MGNDDCDFFQALYSVAIYIKIKTIELLFWKVSFKSFKKRVILSKQIIKKIIKF